EDALIWRTLEQRIVRRPESPNWPCDVLLQAAGSKLDVNSATPDMIVSLLHAMRESDAQASEMSDALSDWRDTDQVESPVGAERAWYASAMRALPRNGPLADIGELALVRG